MVKRILLSIVLLLVIAYLVVAVTAFNRKPASQVCQDVELVIKDTVYAGFITKKEVATLLEKKGISPIGKDLERVRTKTLERELAKHPLIDQVECYKTPNRQALHRSDPANPHPARDERQWRKLLSGQQGYCNAPRCKMRCTPCRSDRKCRKVVCHEGFI